MQDMRLRTGEVDDTRKLVSFLYLILRDHVQPGDVEKVLRDINEPKVYQFTNGHLARYAQDIADRLLEEA